MLAVLALLIFGPERLPKMARNAGQMIAKFKAEANATIEELKVAAELDELTGVGRELKATATELRKTGKGLVSEFDVAGDVKGTGAAAGLTAASASSRGISGGAPS